VDLRQALSCVQGNNPMSISFYLKTTQTSCGTVLFVGSDAGYLSVLFNNGGTSNIIQIYTSNGYYNPTSGTKINDGQWHAVLISYDGTTLYIYVDNVLDNSVNIVLGTSGNSKNSLGAFNYNDGNYLNGRLQVVKFYNYAIIPTAYPTFSPTTKTPSIAPSVTSSKLPTSKPSDVPAVLYTSGKYMNVINLECSDRGLLIILKINHYMYKLFY